MKKYKTYHILTLLLAAMMAVSCSTTKHLPEGETLYLGLKKVTINNEEISLTKKEFEIAVPKELLLTAEKDIMNIIQKST